MNRLMAWLLGLGLGGLAGVLLAAVLVPQSADAVRGRLRAGYREALDEAAKATEARRAELEARLAEMQGG
jgi:hypothetical protein